MSTTPVVQKLTAKALFGQENVKAKFQELLGKNAPAFITSSSPAPSPPWPRSPAPTETKSSFYRDFYFQCKKPQRSADSVARID
jgi:hypothetical protein